MGIPAGHRGPEPGEHYAAEADNHHNRTGSQDFYTFGTGWFISFL
jgi:hypothetical protein